MSYGSKTLYCTEGSSDKEYRISVIEASAGLFHVVCQNGRRGGPLKDQPKTKTPVSLDEAVAIATGIEREKTRKGYTLDESGVAYALTEKAGDVSGWLPCLPTPITPESLPAYLADDEYAVQEKKNGERRGIEITRDGVRGMNRKGLYVSIPQPWIETLARLAPDTILDGEHVGDTLYVFDVVKYGGRDLSKVPFAARAASLEPFAALFAADAFVWFVPTVRGAAAKRELLASIEAAGGEGIVLRNIRGTYRPGSVANPESADLLKFKFQETASAIVTSVHPTKRSVSLAVLDAAGAEIDVGNVTIPANHAIPAVGAIADVRFMYLYEGGSFFQPVYLGVRAEQTREDAVLAKIVRIKRKSDVREEEEEEEAQGVAA